MGDFDGERKDLPNATAALVLGALSLVFCWCYGIIGLVLGILAVVLAVGSPCYWGNLPGELKLLFDRIVYGMMGESPKGIPLPLHKGKKAIIVSTCTTPYPFNILFNQTRGTVKALKEILKWSGFKIVATVERGGTKKSPLQEKDFRLCRKIALKALK